MSNSYNKIINSNTSSFCFEKYHNPAVNGKTYLSKSKYLYQFNKLELNINFEEILNF